MKRQRKNISKSWSGLSYPYIHKEGINPWLQVQQGQNPRETFKDDGNLYTYRISLLNSGLETVRNVQVRIGALRPSNLRGTPHHLHFTNDNQDDQTLFSKSKDLQITSNDLNGLFVDVIAYWRGGDSRQAVNIWHIAHGISRSVPVDTYEFTIFVSSDNGGNAIEQRCRFIPTLNAAPKLEFLS